MSKITFLNPPFHYRFSRESRSPAVAKSGTLYYPKWLSYAAGLAIKKGNQVDLIDAPAKGRSIDYCVDRIKSHDSKFLVIDTSTPSIVNDIKVVKELQLKLPEVSFLMVGRHVSAMPSETLSLFGESEKVPMALKEYEHTVLDWVEAIKTGSSLENVAGLSIYDRKINGCIKTIDRPPLENLDELPFVTEVYKRFLDINDYYYGHSLYPLVVFDTSRGCPFKCTFCVYPQTFSGHTMRYRSPENVAEEFEFVSKELPQVETVMLEDDTFPVDRKRTLSVAKALIKRGNKIPYDSNARADNVSKDINDDINFYGTLKESGARLFCCGIESGDDDVLKHIKKSLIIDKTHQFMKVTRKVGIMVHGCFMYGNLNETQNSMKKTLKLALRLLPDTAQFFPIMVYPGTAAYEEAKQKGLLSTNDFSEWLTDSGLHKSVVNLPNVTHEELVKFCDFSRRKFYLNPRYLLRKAKQSLFSFTELRRNLKGFRSLLPYLIKGSDIK